MKLSFRWFGEGDPVRLEYIRQIPGMKGIVSALYDVPVGEAWNAESIAKLKHRIADAGMELTAIESVPVHEDIKRGVTSRDRYIENYCLTLERLGRAAVDVVCYNFMPIFDWTRSDLAKVLPDGSTALAYDEAAINRMDPFQGDMSLPGWDSSYTKDGLRELSLAYGGVSTEKLWDNLAYFLEAVVPTAEKAGVKLAIHPDDPPWSIFGLPRIVSDKRSLERLLGLVDSPSNGLAICSGSLGADPANDLPDIIRTFGARGRVHFAHCRNIKVAGPRVFEESAHPSASGSLDMVEILSAYRDIGFSGPLRPDHGRMIWGETGKPGYGLFDRALGAAYLNGVWETLMKEKHRL